MVWKIFKLAEPFSKQEKGMIASIHKAALPFNLFIDVLNMEKSKLSKHKVKNMYILLNTQKIFYSKNVVNQVRLYNFK